MTRARTDALFCLAKLWRQNLGLKLSDEQLRELAGLQDGWLEDMMRVHAGAIRIESGSTDDQSQDDSE